MSFAFGSTHKTFNVSAKLWVLVKNLIIVFNSKSEKKDIKTLILSIGFFLIVDKK